MRALLYLALALLVPTGDASSANLVTNSSFDVDTTDWVGNDADVQWDVLDLDGSGSSGSALVLKTQPADAGTMFQRAAADPGATYTLAGCTYLPSGQSGIGYVQLGVTFRAESCEVPVQSLPDVFGTALISAPFDSWICPDPVEFVVPETALCIEVLAFVRNNGQSGTFAAHFDEVTVPEPGTGSLGLAAALALVMGSRLRQA